MKSLEWLGRPATKRSGPGKTKQTSATEVSVSPPLNLKQWGFTPQYRK